MNKRQVVVLWIIALVLGGAAYFAWSGKSKTFESKTDRDRGQTLVADLPADQVAKIQITGAKGSATLVRKDGKWTVAERDGYPAKTNEVNEFLESLASVEVTQGIEAEPSFAPRFGMDPNAKEEKDRGTEVVLSNDAGTELGRFTFGKNLEAAADPMAAMMGGGGSTGRFVRNHADSSGVYVTKEIFPTLSAEPKSWLDPKFVQIEKIKSIAVTPVAKADGAWKVVRADENAEFTLEGAKEGETLDPAVAEPLKNLFSYGRFEDIASPDEASDNADVHGTVKVQIETFEGFNYAMTLSPTLPKEEEKPASAEAAPPEEAMVMMSVEVSAEIPAERKKEEKESPEDAKAKDTAFTERKAALEKKLAAEKALAGRHFKITPSTVDMLMKGRDGLIKKPEAPAAANPGAMAPGGPIAVPQQPRRPVEAVTPPIAIPPLEEGEKEGE